MDEKEKKISDVDYEAYLCLALSSTEDDNVNAALEARSYTEKVWTSQI